MMIMYKFIEAERAASADEFQGIQQSEIIDYIVSKHIEQLNTMEDLNKFMLILKTVIDRMIKVNGMLIVSEESENVETRVLKTNPIYINPFE